MKELFTITYVSLFLLIVIRFFNYAVEFLLYKSYYVLLCLPIAKPFFNYAVEFLCTSRITVSFQFYYMFHSDQNL